jgi:O-antigen/teichoic acid export membrane protein
MLDRLKPKSEFSRNVLTLMTGTTIAQAIPIVIAPILTRIYTPEDFGFFAFYFSIAAILSVTVSGRYELAIILPKRKSHAIQLVFLSWLIILIISLTIGIIIWLFNNEIITFIDNDKLSKWLFFIPFSVLLAGFYQSLYYWFNREKYYKGMSNSRIIQSSGMVSMQSVLGWGGKIGGIGLILGHFFGQLISVAFLLKIFLREERKAKTMLRIQAKKQLILARRYINFPKYMVPGHLMSAFSILSPNILLSIFYTVVSAGYYILVHRVISSPMSIIGSTFSDVFRKEADEQIKKNGDCKALFKRTLKHLVFISLIPFLIFYFLATDLFVFVFGEDWQMAGVYAKILTPMFFLQFIARPLSVLYIIRERQKQYFYTQLLLAIFVTMSFFLFNKIEHTIVFISLSFSLMYLSLLVNSYFYSREIKWRN